VGRLKRKISIVYRILCKPVSVQKKADI
jgi:hypothetical protein